MLSSWSAATALLTAADEIDLAEHIEASSLADPRSGVSNPSSPLTDSTPHFSTRPSSPQAPACARPTPSSTTTPGT